MMSFLGGLSASGWAQTCPSGWTSTTGKIYPVSATGSSSNSDVDNIIFGGVDGNALLISAGTVGTINFGQSLAAGGVLEIVASGVYTSNVGNFSVSFSADGVNFSTSTPISVPANTTMATYTVTAPQAFQYVKITPGSTSITFYDAISYQGTYCQTTVPNYADCSNSESQVWRFVEPTAAAGTYGLTPDNVMRGPDGLKVDLTSSGQSIVTKYAEKFASGDTIVVTGHKYTSIQVGDFQVLTSNDGIDFTPLPAVAFSNVSPNFQTIKVVATQSFQYVKVIRSGFGQITIDAVNVFGKVCIPTPAACASGSTFVTNALLYPVSATGTASFGDINNMVFGGADGNLVRVDAGAVLDFGQTLAIGGRLSIVAQNNNSSNNGSFIASFSMDGINFQNPTTITIPVGAITSLQTYNIIVPQAFRYLKLASVGSGTASTGYTWYDAVSYQGEFCKPPVISYAECGNGESQVWRFMEPTAVAGTYGISPDNATYGPDGAMVNLTTTAQSIITKYAKSLAAGDTIVVTGYKYSSSQVGTFQVLTSMDGVNFTALPSVTFTQLKPYYETVKLVAMQPFQYVKVIPLNFGQVIVDAVNVFGKACKVPTSGCTLSYLPSNAQNVSGTAYFGAASNAEELDGIIGVIPKNGSFIADFGQTISSDADIYVVAGNYLTHFEGSFSVAISDDGINFTTIKSSFLPIISGTQQVYTITQTYQFHSPTAFRYVRLTAGSNTYVSIDHIGVSSLICPPCNVTATASAIQATCTATGVNANAAITLTAFGGEATKVGYSAGSSYTGASYASAMSLTAAPFTVTNTLPNPTSAQPYVVRVFQSATCYKDFQVILNPKYCITGNGSLTISPAQLSANKGETVSFTVTVTNSGPDAVPNTQVRVPIPANTTLLSTNPQQGAYSSVTQKWDVGTIPVGNTTMTVTLKIN